MARREHGLQAGTAAGMRRAQAFAGTVVVLLVLLGRGWATWSMRA
jgi:hypothetical protein